MFIDALGDKAEDLLARYRDRAALLLVRAVTDEHRRYTAKPTYEEVVDLHRIGKPRTSARKTSADRHGPFSKQTAYEGWKRSLYAANWFDSRPERTIANILDASDDITCWIRLATGDLPILWRSDGRTYNADLIAIDNNDNRWVIEIKSNKDAPTAEVQAKREAAKRWANHVNADDKVPGTWHYLLLTEADIDMAKDSWSALKNLGA